jgi:hypothetical protein
MTRTISALIAVAAVAGSLIAVQAATVPAPTILSTTADGKPIVLKRTVIVGTALPDNAAL